MATVIKYKINGIETEPYREAFNLNVSAVFGTEAQPSVSLDSIILVDTAKAQNSKLVRDLWATNPVEGVPFDIQITDGTNLFEFNFYMDFTKMRFLSDIETEIGLVKKSSIEQFDLRAQAITQTLLYSEGKLNGPDFQPVPYVVENRKTNLEKFQILQQTYNTIKSLFDEGHKLLNLASDIPTLGVAAATANAILTISNIVLLIQQLIDLFTQIIDLFFPPVRYHIGLKPKTFIENAAVDYMGYDSVEFGTISDIMERETWLGSKNNEVGALQAVVLTGPGQTLLNLLSGLFKPNDVGYFLADTIAILEDKYRLKKAIINNVLHLRPENDPFWTTQSGYVLPDLKIEQIFAGNGTVRPNYEDLIASRLIQYNTDDSDLWTLEDLADETNENSTGKIISVKTIEAQTVGDQQNVLLRGSKFYNIPHCLASRKDQIDDLLDLFLGSADNFGALKAGIEAILDQWAATIGQGSPAIADLITTIGNRSGAIKVENHFFSVPKQMLLENTAFGLPTIPANFADEIGAKALLENYHSWDSFITGQRNPAEPQQTAAKYIYEEIKIPFGLTDFVTVLNNAYFVTVNGEVGKFTALEWNIEGDYAIATYWIYQNWVTNIDEVIT